MNLQLDNDKGAMPQGPASVQCVVSHNPSAPKRPPRRRELRQNRSTAPGRRAWLYPAALVYFLCGEWLAHHESLSGRFLKGHCATCRCLSRRNSFRLSAGFLPFSYSQPDRLNPNHSPLHTTAIAPTVNG